MKFQKSTIFVSGLGVYSIQDLFHVFFFNSVENLLFSVI